MWVEGELPQRGQERPPWGVGLCGTGPSQRIMARGDPCGRPRAAIKAAPIAGLARLPPDLPALCAAHQPVHRHPVKVRHVPQIVKPRLLFALSKRWY